MTQLGYHLRFHLRDDSVIAPDLERRRVLARVIIEHGRHAGLYAFGYPDTHVHLAVRATRQDAGRLTRNIESALRQRLKLEVGFVQYPPKALVDQGHLTTTVKYILRQVERHSLALDPRREGTSLPDVLGMRPLGAYVADNLAQWLPRLGRGTWLELLGFPALSPCGGTPEQVLAATLAAGCRADLRGRTPEVVALRRAALEVLGTGLKTGPTADLLEVSDRSVQWLRAQPVDTVIVRAIQLQLGLSRSLAEAGLGEY